MTSDTPFFSIIVPVFNVQDYLGECVSSVLVQDFDSFELILVDDGSRDGCPAMCDGYAAHDRRVRVVHKPNGGLSSARNAGMDIARGQYLLFIDGDDYIARDSFATIAQELGKRGFPDIMFLSADCVYPDGSMRPYGAGFTSEDFVEGTRDEALRRLSRGGQFHVSACVKAIKRGVGGDLLFMEGVVGEDVDFSLKLYLRADSFAYCGVPYYRYRQMREGSIMSEQGSRRYGDLLTIVCGWVERAEDGTAADREWIYRFLYHQYYVLLWLYGGISREARALTRGDIRRLSFLLRHTGNPKARLLLACLRVFGPGAASLVVRFADGGKRNARY